jgi:hypothetical protein
VNVVVSLFKSKSRLEAENAALRHQLTVLQRKVRDLHTGSLVAGIMSLERTYTSGKTCDGKDE